ncbi:MAG: hypothetical protein AAF378_18805 [Cyanobacteria bacterium P01_A01_bin.84]
MIKQVLFFSALTSSLWFVTPIMAEPMSYGIMALPIPGKVIADRLNHGAIVSRNPPKGVIVSRNPKGVIASSGEIFPTITKISTQDSSYCADGMRFPDVSKNHWAYNAVKKLSSCRSQNQASAPVRDLEQIPIQVIIAGRTYTIESYIWRDFMPISPSGGKGMMANIKLIAQDENPIPSNLLPDKLWVIKKNQDEVWETMFSDEPRFSPGVVEIVARGGPKWEPGIKVDVVVRLSSRGTLQKGEQNDSNTYFLRLPNQTIQRTS